MSVPCPVCQGESRYSASGRCNAPYHNKDRKPARRSKRPMRFLSERGDTVRGECCLSEMEPEDRTFGGPGKVVVPVDAITGGDAPCASRCDDKDCETCNPKRPAKRKRPTPPPGAPK